MKKKLGSQRCTASFSINKKPFSRIFPSYYFFPVLFHPHTEVTALPVCRHASLQPRPSPSDTRTTVTQVCVHGRARQVKPQQRLELSAQGSVFRLLGSHQPLQHLRKSSCAVFTSRTLPPLWDCRLQRNSRARPGCRTLTSPISSLTTGTTPLTLVKPW